MTARIGCRDLVVRAEDRVILSVEALDVAVGETLAVLGPNGAGKSTLVRALALLVPHAAGTVLLDGKPANRPSVREAVAAVLQRPVLRRGTVVTNVASGLRMRGIRRGEALRRAKPWLARLGVADLAGRDARSLSGGEAQRVALARALAVRPRVLVLDEPFAALDATTRADLVADLRTVLRELDCATILVTHDRYEAAALADRTALLVGGALRQVGPTAAVLDSPVDVDCARIVGYSTVLPPELTGRSDTVVARGEHTVPLVDPAAAPAGAIVVPGRLHRIVPLGGVTRLDVTAAGTTVACLVAGEPGAAIGVGGSLWIAVPPDRLRPLPCR